MKIHIENTSKIVHLNGVPARVWEGVTESGTPVHCFITRIAPTVPPDDSRNDEFAKQLQKQAPPSVEIAAYPMRMIL